MRSVMWRSGEWTTVSNNRPAVQGTDAAGLARQARIWAITGPAIAGLHFSEHSAAITELAAIKANAHNPVDPLVGYP